MPTQHNLEKFYTTTFDYSAGFINETKIRKRARAIYKKIKTIHPDGLSLLDIGAGYGFLLDEMNKKGLKTEGIEPSAKLYHYAKMNLKQNVIKTSFEDYNPNKKFDYVMLIHSIEHVRNPETFLQKIETLLNPGGVLFIETPNLDSHLFTAEQKNYTFLLAPDHVWIFSLTSFDYLLRKWKSIRYTLSSTYSNPEHFMSIVKHAINKKISNDHLNTKKTKIQTVSSQPFIKTSLITRTKIVFFDQFLAKLCVGFLNLKNKGSTLELYIKKN